MTHCPHPHEKKSFPGAVLRLALLSLEVVCQPVVGDLSLQQNGLLTHAAVDIRQLAQLICGDCIRFPS